jgi:glyoxylase-like metal-dependent hydrolase (beta-lactamase superfamily II)
LETGVNTRRLFRLAAAALVAASAVSPAQTARKVTRLAEGVYAIEHARRPFESGNTTVIIGERQVFVVDSCFLPSAAREDIAQIRQWTDKPVSFLLNTHFHNDHNLGNRAYLEAFPALTIMAHAETKADMDRFGPGSFHRLQQETAPLQQMLDTGKTRGGTALTADDRAAVRAELERRAPGIEEVRLVKFQSATMTFDHDFTIDLGNREVDVRFLGRGNTAGDAVVVLPKERIAVVGDLVVYPVPYIYDGYPVEWIQTLEKLSRLDVDTIVPGHGPVMHDMAYVLLVRDLLRSAVDQMNTRLAATFPAMALTLDDVKGSVDLSVFRQRFVGAGKNLDPAFDEMATNLVKVVFEEASLR